VWELFLEYFKNNWILKREKCPHWKNRVCNLWIYVFIGCLKIYLCLLPTWFLYAYLILLFCTTLNNRHVWYAASRDFPFIHNVEIP
jgi:hypothetical protein